MLHSTTRFVEFRIRIFSVPISSWHYLSVLFDNYPEAVLKRHPVHSNLLGSVFATAPYPSSSYKHLSNCAGRHRLFSFTYDYWLLSGYFSPSAPNVPFTEHTKIFAASCFFKKEKILIRCQVRVKIIPSLKPTLSNYMQLNATYHTVCLRLCNPKRFFLFLKYIIKRPVKATWYIVISLKINIRAVKTTNRE